MKSNMILVKLGGGLIAPKEWEEETADIAVIKRLVKEIKDSRKRALVVSGSGNFGHKAAKKYGIETSKGVEKVRRSAKKIGEIVTSEMKNAGFDARLVETHKFFQLNQKLNLEKTLVFYGDVVEINKNKWTIYSGEKIISLLVPTLIERGVKIDKIIQVSKEQGVWDSRKKIIPEINSRNWGKIRKDVFGSEGVDMTGGMLHKVEESLEIAQKYNLKTYIVGGKSAGRLGEILKNDKVTGTLIY